MNYSCATLFVLDYLSLIQCQYFSHHGGSILNRNGKRSHLFDMSRSMPLTAENNQLYELNNPETLTRQDKLSLKKSFSKLGRRDQDESVQHLPTNLIRKILLEYLDSQRKNELIQHE